MFSYEIWHPDPLTVSGNEIVGPTVDSPQLRIRRLGDNHLLLRPEVDPFLLFHIP